MFKGNFAAGSVTGTGAALNVELGFEPSYVRVVNISNATTASLEWIEGMAAANAIKEIEIVDSGTTALSSINVVTTDGISRYAGAISTAAKGFTIGADAHVNVSGNTLAYIAFGRE